MIKIKQKTAIVHLLSQRYKLFIPTIFLIAVFCLSLIPTQVFGLSQNAILPICGGGTGYSLSTTWLNRMVIITGHTIEEFESGSYIVIALEDSTNGDSQLIWSGSSQIMVDNSTTNYFTVRTPTTAEGFDTAQHIYGESISKDSAWNYSNNDYQFVSSAYYATQNTYVNSNAGSFYNGVNSNDSCVVAANNLNYATGFQGTDYSSIYSTPPPEPPETNLVWYVSGNNVTLTGVSVPALPEESIDLYYWWFDVTDSLNIGAPDVIVDTETTGGYAIHVVDTPEGGYASIQQYSYPQARLAGGPVRVCVSAFSSNGNNDSMCEIFVLGGSGIGGSFLDPEVPEPIVDIPCGTWDFACILGQTLKFLFIPKPEAIEYLFSNTSTNTNGLESIITVPLEYIADINTVTCTPIDLPLPYVTGDITLPCMSSNYSTYFGDFFTMYQTIVTGVISYWVIVRFLDLVKNFKDPKSDTIEVLDL